MGPNRAVRVIYILGAGRSGSTVLGVTLGNLPGCFYAGELDAYARRGGIPTPERLEVREFWGRVRGRLQDQQAVEPDPAWHATFEQPRGILGRWRGGARREYVRFNASLYEAVAREAAVTTVVDSSHYPIRLLQLRGAPGVDFVAVYLVRDPLGVVASLQTDLRPKSRLAANLYLWSVHILAEAAYRSIRGPRVRVRYEDFLADPIGHLTLIGAMAGLTDAGGEVRLDALRTGTPFAGNRIIKQREVALRRIPSRDETPDAMTSLIQLVWRCRYGYQPWRDVRVGG